VEHDLTLSYARHDIRHMRIEPEVLAELCERNDIDRLRIFGSVARGEDSGASDIDLIADFTRRKSLMDLVRIERDFSDRLGRKVDLFTERALSPYLRTRILREALVLYERAA
jgi:predicted nucleotidyltransferase